MVHYDSDIADTRIARIDKGRVGKRLLDITFALSLLPIILPIIALLWAVIRLDGGSGFFGHVRVGRGKRPFRCWKLRTMVVDAEERLGAYLASNAAAAAEWERDRKLTDDPRVTRLGRLLRETSLDELPQILNVLRGEMSFVGPRPITAPELARYRRHEWAYLSVKPGITGLWQVSGRNDVDYDTRIRMDVTYARTRSLLGDLKIIARTGGAVLNRTGR
jgi:lipopolysaccharide/colanic/teichoic acid biosynthesis glycosyltransferase